MMTLEIRHGLGVKVSLSQIQRTPAIPYNITKLCCFFLRECHMKIQLHHVCCICNFPTNVKQLKNETLIQWHEIWVNQQDENVKKLNVKFTFKLNVQELDKKMLTQWRQIWINWWDDSVGFDWRISCSVMEIIILSCNTLYYQNRYYLVLFITK